HPQGTLAAWCALTARLVGVERRDILRRSDDIRGFVQDDHAAGTRHRARLLDGVEVELHVELLGEQDWHRAAAGDDAFDLAALGWTAAHVVDELTQRERAVLDLEVARALHVAAHAHDAGTARTLDAHRREPRAAVVDDVRDVAQRLDVVDHRRAAEHARDGGERRLDARVGAFAFERLDQARFFAADVRAGAAVHVQLQLETGPEDVLAEQASGLGFGDGVFHDLYGARELAAQVDVAYLATD